MTSIAERRKFILDNIFQNGFVRVADLADALKVTQTTIRKDLTYLEGQGLLYRAYGSALPTTAQVMDISLNTWPSETCRACRSCNLEASCTATRCA